MPAAVARREGRLVHQHAAAVQWHDKALEPPGDARSRAVVHAPPGQARAGALRRLASASATGRSATSTWDYPEHGEHARARRRGRCSRRSTATTSPTGEPVAGFARAQGRRLDRLRLLDLLRRLRRRRQPGRAAATRATSTRPAAGSRPSGAGWPANRRILYNRASADPDGQAVVGAQDATSGGTRTQGKWTGYDVPDFPVDKPPDYRARRRREGHGRDRRRRPVHHDGRRQGLAVRAARACSTARCRRTTSRSSRRSTNLLYPEHRRNPAALTLDAPGQPVRPRPATRATRTCHDLPADRAPHRRRR